MEIRVIEIGNGYLIHSDRDKKPEFRHQAVAVKVYIEGLVRDWLTKEIQKENE